jgi:hypothetical protein
MAGWYMGAKFGLGLLSIDRETFAQSLFLKGVQGQRNSFNPNLYGSPEQRVSAMRFGFDYGYHQIQYRHEPDVYEAAQEGYTTVRGMAK